jgi:hypothetical protein
MKTFKNLSTRNVAVALLCLFIASGCEKLTDKKDKDDETTSETLSGILTENRTLVNRNGLIDYVIDGTYSVQGSALLTIEPGVKIVFTGANGRITVEENAGLRMVGTAEAPIILTGPVNNPNKGAWNQVWVKSNRADNQFEFVHFINGGSNEDWSVIELDFGAKLKMNNCLIDGSLGSGIICSHESSKLSEFNNNVIKNCQKSPMVFSDIMQLTTLNKTSDFRQNGMSHIKVMTAWIEQTLTLPEVNVPIFIENNVGITNGTFTIPKGTSLLITGGQYIEVRDNGILKINGTASEPVLLSKVGSDLANWGGLLISNNNANTVSYCTIEYGGNGYDNSNVTVNGKVTLNNVNLRNTGGYGISYWEASQITSSAVTFSNCTLGNVYNLDTETVRATL